jgi:hypothetical protein
MRRIVFLLSILLATIGVSAQQTVTVQAQSYQVSDNLDLEAVAITFGESKNVEDFERRLNDPDNRISNLDLNNDGYVDFLRVVEVEEKGTHLLVIQAVIGQDLYQDVASVIVEGENRTTATVTIVGNRDIYGNTPQRQAFKHPRRNWCSCNPCGKRYPKPYSSYIRSHQADGA